MRSVRHLPASLDAAWSSIRYWSAHSLTVPSLQRWGLFIVEFKAENRGRKRKHQHQHLFILKDTAKALKADGLPLKAAISKVPIEDWVAVLEDGWEPIKETHFFYA